MTRRTSFILTARRLVAAALLGFVILMFSACQRTLPPELPYDQTTSDSLRKDFDSFAE